MSTPKRLNCVQLGLYDTLEYAYVLGEDALKGVDIGVSPHKPISFSPGAHWHYYGVDCSRPCIAHWHSQQIPRTTWINAFVGGEPGIASVGEEEGYYTLRVKNFSTDSDNVYIGIVTLDMLFAGLGLESVEILALDIESAELAVFETYSWKVRPRFIDVEVHNTHPVTKALTEAAGLAINRKRVDAIIAAAGYQLIGYEHQDNSVGGKDGYESYQSHLLYRRSPRKHAPNFR